MVVQLEVCDATGESRVVWELRPAEVGEVHRLLLKRGHPVTGLCPGIDAVPVKLCYFGGGMEHKRNLVPLPRRPGAHKGASAGARREHGALGQCDCFVAERGLGGVASSHGIDHVRVSILRQQEVGGLHVACLGEVENARPQQAGAGLVILGLKHLQGESAPRALHARWGVILDTGGGADHREVSRTKAKGWQ